VVPLDPPGEEDEPETAEEENCRIALAQDTSRGARAFKQVRNMYAHDSRLRNVIEGVRGGKVLPAFERQRSEIFKRKD
jgi:hypothetical protein